MRDYHILGAILGIEKCLLAINLENKLYRETFPRKEIVVGKQNYYLRTR